MEGEVVGIAVIIALAARGKSVRGFAAVAADDRLRRLGVDNVPNRKPRRSGRDKMMTRRFCGSLGRKSGWRTQEGEGNPPHAAGAERGWVLRHGFRGGHGQGSPGSGTERGFYALGQGGLDGPYLIQGKCVQANLKFFSNNSQKPPALPGISLG